MPPVLRSGDETKRAARRAAPFRAARREASGLVTSFNYAFEGIIYVVRTQRNMRIHFLVALAVLPLGVAARGDPDRDAGADAGGRVRPHAEMVNTALEKTIDVATTRSTRVARAAKDIAAGAVLVAAVNAALRRLPGVRPAPRSIPAGARSTPCGDSPVHLTVIAIAVVILLVIAIKAQFGRGTPLRGGLPSGHAAVAFGGWAAVTFVTQRYENQVLVSTLVFMMALLVAQTRVEAGCTRRSRCSTAACWVRW